MKKSFFMIILVCLSFLFCGCSSLSWNYQTKRTTPKDETYFISTKPIKISSESEKQTTEVAQQVVSAVVGISSTSKTSESIGSGVCVASGGLILTNHHVIDGAGNIEIYLSDGSSESASLLWSDANLDLALVKCEKEIPYLEMCSYKTLQVGQDILAVGTPLSLQFKHSFTKGIVSALGRAIEVSDGYLQNLIQHDAGLNPGNSGGPLLNLAGQVVGINTLKASDAEALGFAIPIDVALPIIEKIAKDGNFDPPTLGIYGFDSDIASFSGLSNYQKGVYVMNIESSGNLAKAGAKVGDIITKFDGTEIANMLDLRVALFGTEKGQSVSIEIKRDNETKTLSATLN